MAIKKTTQKNADAGLMCAWNDHGQTCSHMGCNSNNPQGGPWYCREHYYRMMGYGGMEGKHGNELPTPSHSHAVETLRAARKRREPGQDDEEIAA